MMDFMNKLLKSKTIIFNVVVIIAVVLTALLQNDVIQQNPEVMAYLVAIAGGVNVVLRFLTATSLFGKIDEVKIPEKKK
jgi:hypothetical protein